MGGFYGSIHVRTADRDAVVHAAEAAATAAQIRCLIGPALNGWVGVYPEGAGQDQSIGHAIARSVGGDVLQLAVHDDELLVYWLWHEAELTDTYWSRPGYFYEADRAAQMSLSGDAQAFGDLLAGKERLFTAILNRRRTDLPFEADRLRQLAELLGIPNAVTSYEYLKAGETAGIEHLEAFVEVPAEAVAAEQAIQRAKRQQIERTKEQLRREYRLLADTVEDRLLPRACAVAGGFLVAWEGFGRGENRIEFFRAPWGEAEPGEIEPGGQVNSVASDAMGRRVAMALGNRVVIYDSVGWQPILELVEADWATQAVLSPDGSLLAYACRQGVYVHHVESGQRITALAAHEAQALAFHPNNQWLIAAGSAFWVAKVHDTEPWRELYPGGQAALPEDLSQAVKKEMGRVDIDAMERKWRSALETSVAKLAASGQDSPAARAAIDKMRGQMEKQLEQMRAKLATLKTGHIPAPREGREKVLCAGFTADGLRLWCGAEQGLHVYEWSAIESAPPFSGLPSPVFSHTPMHITPSGSLPAMIYAAAFVPGRNTLLFGGYDGILAEMNLRDGNVRELATPPDGGAIVGIAVSSDAHSIGVCSRPALGAGGAKDDERAVWEIWNYAMP